MNEGLFTGSFPMMMIPPCSTEYLIYSTKVSLNQGRTTLSLYKCISLANMNFHLPLCRNHIVHTMATSSICLRGGSSSPFIFFSILNYSRKLLVCWVLVLWVWGVGSTFTALEYFWSAGYWFSGSVGPGSNFTVLEYFYYY